MSSKKNSIALKLAGMMSVLGIDFGYPSREPVVLGYSNLDKAINRRKIMVRTGGTVFGPSFGPIKEWIHESRQVKRESLFRICFLEVSQKYFRESRRTRRALARARAHFMYRQGQAELRANDPVA